MPHFIRSFYPVCLIAMSSAILGCNDPEFRLPDTSDAGVDANADMMDVEDLSDMHIEDMTEDLGIIVDLDHGKEVRKENFLFTSQPQCTVV